MNLGKYEMLKTCLKYRTRAVAVGKEIHSWGMMESTRVRALVR